MSDAGSGMPEEPGATTVRPSPARLWHYLQGGKDYQAIDRNAAEAMLEINADLRYHARQAREFLTRAVLFLTVEAGVRQFLDLGCGLPGPAGTPDIHELVQRTHPDGRVVYVDSDKVVLAHARALLTPHTPGGVCAYIDSDVRDIDRILDEAGQTLDYSQPVGVTMFGILGAIPYAQAKRVVGRLVETLPSGSYFAFEDGADLGTSSGRDTIRRRHDTGVDHYELRSTEQMHSYFAGLEILEPGLVTVTAWRPPPADIHESRPVDPYGCVVRIADAPPPAEATS